MTQPFSIDRRSLLGLLGAAAIPSAFAQSNPADKYPDHLIRLVNPWTPGGPGDVVGRPITDIMAKAWKQSVILDSRPGADAVIGSTYVSKAPPDGYTLLLGQTGPNTISPTIGKGTPYDPIKDFAPISQITAAPLTIAVRPDLPIKSIADLIAYAKAHPKALTFGSVGIGSTGHLAGEMLKSMASFDMQHVPYKGAVPALTDMFGGQISMVLLNLAGVMPFAKSDKMRIIAVTTAKRSSFLPDVPTVAELIPDYEMTSWYALLAPAGTPAPIIDKIYKTVSEAMRTPEVIAIYRTAGQELALTTPDEFAKTLKTEIAKWSKLVKEHHITGD
jgi:tripartite-type tricarboxylate transporter receptor subunit TctC